VSAVLDGEDSDSDASVSPMRSVSPCTAVPVSLPEGKTEIAPLFSPHIKWSCSITGPALEFPVTLDSMIDCGCLTVLIQEDFVTSLGLHRRKLSKPQSFDVAMHPNEKEKTLVVLHEWCMIKVSDPHSRWHSKSLRTIVAPNLCSPLVLGLSFLTHNEIVVDFAAHTVFDKKCSFDLLNPREIPVPPTEKLKPKEKRLKFKRDYNLFKRELKEVLKPRKAWVEQNAAPIKRPNFVGAVRERIEILAAGERLQKLGERIKIDFKEVFEPIPHVETLPSDVYCRIKLKDASKSITSRSYSCPRRYKEAWATLIQQHVDAGRIRPSNLEHASPAFLVPKVNPVDMPQWVNDYRQLNNNTVIDSHPLPRVDDILADCAKGKIWSKIDMTNSFFQT
jgi:hypothetical protein